MSSRAIRVALSAAAVAALLGTALVVPAGADDDYVAVSAKKKKCKKGKRKSLAGAAKKKCRKQPSPSPATPTPPAPPAAPALPPVQTLRMTLTWNKDADLDLHVWDALGNEAFTGNLTGVPGGTTDVDNRLQGPEKFFAFDGLGRDFTYGVCYVQPVGADAAAPPFNQPMWTADGVKADGSTFHLTGSVSGTTGASRRDVITVPPGGFNPAADDDWCPLIPFPT